MSSLSLNDALPRRRSRMPWIIGGIVAMVVLLVLGVLASVVWSGVNSFNDQAYTAIRADPAIVDAVGKISDIHLDFEATGDAPGDEEFAYRIIGDRASGLPLSEVAQTTNNRFREGRSRPASSGCKGCRFRSGRARAEA